MMISREFASSRRDASGGARPIPPRIRRTGDQVSARNRSQRTMGFIRAQACVVHYWQLLKSTLVAQAAHVVCLFAPKQTRWRVPWA
jgi:hypothetical protein